jgi:hypothetical protein
MSDALKGARDLVADYREFAAQVQAAASPGSAPRAAPRSLPKSEIRAANRELVKAFAKDFRRGGWEIEVPGTHYSGLSNTELLEVRAAEGRGFNAHTVQLDQHVTKELTRRWAGFDARVVTVDELREDAADAVRIYVATRILHGGVDVPVPALTPRYAAAKRKAGYGGRPIGVRRGRHLAAIQSKLTLRWRS